VKSNHPSPIKTILNCAIGFGLSAVLLTVIQPPVEWASLAWVAMVPFLVVCSPKMRARELVVTAYACCLIYWLVNLYWLVPVTIAGWIAFCAYTALLWPILALSVRYCRRRKVPLVLASAVLIVGVEQMQGLFLGGFFWRFLGHSQFRNIELIQIADLFGAAGVSLLVALVNGMIAEVIVAIAAAGIRRKGRPAEGQADTNARQSSGRLVSPALVVKILGVCGLVAAAILYGRWRIEQSKNCIEPGPIVGTVQSNVPQSVKRTFQSSKEIFNELIELSKAATGAGAELVIWPETMVQAALSSEVLRAVGPSHLWSVLHRALQDHARQNAYVLVGAYGGLPKIDEQGNVTGWLRRYNSAFLYDSQGRQLPQQYNKIHLVPFGEVLPFRKSLPWLYNLLMKFTPYNYDYSLDYGTEYTIFEMIPMQPDLGRAGDDELQIQPWRFGVMICYEDVVPEIARRFVLDDKGSKRIDWLVNISNDGWFVRFDDQRGLVKPSAELAQHVAVCAFRAVENRLAIVRSVNTGISCVIDSLGRIRDDFLAGTLPEHALERTGMAGWFVDRVPVDNRVSFFSKYGRWLDFCCEGCVVLLIIVQLVEKLLRRPGRPETQCVRVVK